MKRSRTKVMTLSLLAIAIIGLSIGFAVFSSTLNIQSKASINPTNNFSVKFASQASTSDQGLIYQDNTENFPVSKNLKGSASAEGAIIDNTQENPTISNLNATLTSPGDSVTYTFYVVNIGEYDAYLTNLVFNNIQGESEFKQCVADESSSNPASNASSVCSGINLSVKLGDENPVQETTTFNSHLLEKNNYEEVIVTISYTGEVYADGAVTVSFGNIGLRYSTTTEPIALETQEENPWLGRGLKSAKVQYNKTYKLQSENDNMPEEVAIYSNGSLQSDKSYTSSQIDNLIKEEAMEVSNDNIIMQNDESTYLAIVFTDEDTVDVSVAPNSVDFTTEEIIENAIVSATFEVEEEKEVDDLIPTATQTADAYYIESQDKYVFAMDLQNNNGVHFSGTTDSLSLAGITYNNILYIWLPNQNAVDAAIKMTGNNFEAKKWYYGPTNMSSFQVYDGECPISLNDFPDIYSQEYVERVIASFSK